MRPDFKYFSSEIPVETREELDIVNLTGEIERKVHASGVDKGIVNLFVAGQTVALTTIEYEPGAVSDLKAAISRIAPADIHYHHDARWGDGNGRSHIRASLLGPSMSIPVRDGSPFLGTWQQVILVELDTRARSRTVHLTVLGEGNSE
jgi:secondary thiamine-phosphate synthase enzyme